MNTNIPKRAREASPEASSGRRAAGTAWTAVLLLLATIDLRAGVPNGVVVGSVCGGGLPLFYGYVEGNPVNSTAAKFHTPIGLALDGTGEYLFVADCSNNAVRVVDLSSSSTHFNFTYTFAPIPGFTSGTITNPVGVALDADDNVYVLNRGNGRNGMVVKFDSYGYLLATNAVALTNANGIALDSAANAYVTASNSLFKITSGGVKTTVATVTNAGACLQGLVVRDDGMIAACDSGRHGILLINPNNGAISNLTGFNGAGDNNIFWQATPNYPVTKAYAMFNQPMGLAKAGNNMLVVADYGNNRVKVVDASSGTVTNLYGVNSNLWCGNCAPDCTEPSAWPGWYDGPVVVPDACGDVSARLPNGVLVAQDGTVYATEDYYHLIRKVTGANLPPIAPRPPTSLTASADCGQVSLTWSTSPGATSYNVKRSTTSGGPYTNDTIASISATNYSDASVLSGTTYYYVVSAVGAGGEGPNSVEVSATPPLPYAPTILTVVTNYGQVTLTWSTVSCSDVTYHVKRFTVSGGPYSTLANTSSTNYLDTNVFNGTTYYYVVSAANAGGESPNSAERSATPPPLPAPTILNVVTNFSQVTLTWSAIPSISITYNVKRSPSSGGPYTIIANTSSTSYTDTNVLHGATYYYVVSALGAGGESPNSTERSATLPLPPVPDPQIGYVDFPATTNPPYSSVFHPVSSFVLNNDAFIVIEGTPGSQTFYTYGPTSGSIPNPTSASASAPVGYQDGLFPSQAASFAVFQTPPPGCYGDLTIKTIGEKSDGSPNSAIVQARFQFITANPIINGNNAAQFTVSELTTNAEMWYTIDGTDPTNAAPSFGPITTNSATLSFNASTALTFKVRAFRNNYQPSAIVTTTLQPSSLSVLFNGPRGLALNTVGSLLYIADQTNNAIQALNLANNLTTTFLNTNNGISRPVDVAVDSSDNLYVLNQSTPGNGYILEFDRFGNVLATNAAKLALPTALKLDGYGSLFVAEQGGTIQQFTSAGVSNSLVTITSAGVELEGLALFDDGTIVVSDAGNHVIWQVHPVTKAVTLLTGSIGVPGSTLGAASFAKLNQPQQLARAAGNLLVAADYGNNRLVVIDRSGAVTNVLNSTNALVWYGRSGDPHGNGDSHFVAMMAPVGVALSSAGEVFTSEALYNDIRKLLNTGLASTPLPSFPTPIFNGPRGLALNSAGSVLYTADQANDAIQALNLANNLTTTFLNTNNGISQPVDVAVDSSDNLYVLNQSTPGNGFILKFDQFGNLMGTVASNLALPTVLKLDGYGSLFVTEQGGAVQQFSGGTSNTLATITTAGVQLQGLALFNDGTIAVSDAGNHVLWQINPVTKAVTLLTGMVGSPGTSLGAVGYAKLNQPHQLARAAGNLLVAADYGNNRLVVIDRSGSITNVLNSTNALVWYGRTGDPHGSTDVLFAPMVAPVGVALGNDGGVYASEVVYDDIRRIPGTGLLPPPLLPLQHPFSPMGIALDTSGAQLYIADLTNNAVQVLHLGNNQTETFLDARAGILQPVDVVVDSTNHVYVLNQGTGGNGSILEFNQYGNLLRTNAAGLALPTALTMDSFGNVFVTEKGGAVQQFSSGSSNTLFTITNAGVQLQGIALFSDGTVAVSDAGNDVIWQVNPVTHAVTLLTGTLGVPGTTLGSASFAKLNQPNRLARAAGNLLVAADSGNNRLVVVDRAGSITNVLNSTNASVWYGRSDDPQTSSGTQLIPMVSPVGVALGNDGGVYASEVVYDDIRKISSTGLLPPSPLPLQHPFSPMGIALDASGAQLYIADLTNNAVQVLHLGNNQTETFLDTSTGILQPVDVAVDYANNLYVLNQGTGGNGSILEFDQYGNLLQTNAAGLALPTALTMDTSGNFFVAEKGGAVLQFNSGSSTPLFTITNANVQLQGIASFDDGTVAVSDAGNHVIWQFNPATHAITLLSGTPGVPGTTLGSASFAKLNQPYRLARAAGNLLVAADSGNNRLVVVDRAGSITNVLNSTNASVWYGRSDDPQTSSGTQLIPMLSPVGLAVGNDGGVYASEVVYHDIRKLPATGLLPPPTLPTPVISPNSGYYPMGQIITVSSPNPKVYYTGDGSEPTTNSLPVTMSGNVGYIKWFNSTNDLTFLRVKAFNASGASDTVAGQPVTINTIGVPPDSNPAIYAGIGSQIVVPVVVNLQPNASQPNATIQSLQFRVEISPNGSAQPISSGFAVLSLGAGPNDFIPLASPLLDGRAGSITISNYSIGSTAGLEIAALGPNAMSFHDELGQPIYFAVVALLRIAIPYGTNTHEGDSYTLVVRYPSATADGMSDAVPLTPMVPATILVTNIAYKVGDSASMSGGWSVSGGWYNAGGFGNGDLDNSDANLAFIASSGGPVPFPFSDLFNAMDAWPVDAAGFVGGNGLITYMDWNVILQRSLRLDTNNWARAWSAGGNLVDFPTTLTASDAMPKDLQPKSPPPWPWYRQALVGGVSTGNAVPGRTVNVPVYVKLSDGAALSGVQFRAVVTPQGGAPSLTQAPQLSLASGVPGPTLQQSFKANDAAFGWALGSFNYLSRSSNFLGWVTFTLPASAQSGQTYSVSFANADGAPNLSVQYDFETRSACVAVGGSAPPASICSDEWKIHFFGSLTNPSAGDLADPDGDGVLNWMEYLAGTDPTDPKSRLQLSGSATRTGKAQSQMEIHWLTAPGKAYEVQWSSSLLGGFWNTLAAISGDGTVASCSDTNLTAAVRYYRLHVLP